MSHRLQVLIPEDLDAELRKASERARISRGEWVRRAIEAALADSGRRSDAVARLASLEGPTGPMDLVLAEIEAGRR